MIDRIDKLNELIHNFESRQEIEEIPDDMSDYDPELLINLSKDSLLVLRHEIEDEITIFDRKSKIQTLDGYIEDLYITWTGERMDFQVFMKISEQVSYITDIPKDVNIFNEITCTMQQSKALALWIYKNSGAFWVPENHDDVWKHLQYIYCEFTRVGVQAKMEKKINLIGDAIENLPANWFVSRKTWEDQRSPLISITDTSLNPYEDLKSCIESGMIEKRQAELKSIEIQLDNSCNLRDNFESYKVHDVQSIKEGHTQRNLVNNSMENITASIERFTNLRSEHNQTSDRQCLEKRITEIRRKWRRGPTSFEKILEIAYLIAELTEIAKEIRHFYNYKYIAYWIYTNSREFWVPDDNTDVWNHLQYIYNECTRSGVQSRAKELYTKQMASTGDKLEPVSFVTRKSWDVSWPSVQGPKMYNKDSQGKDFCPW